MKRLNNRGVSLIEILIAVVIFALCVTPIIAQLASSIRIGQRADDQQAATDYGKSVAETMKQTDLDSLFYTSSGQSQFADSLGIDLDSMNIEGSYYSVKAGGSNGVVIPQGSYITGRMTPGSGMGFASVTAMYQALNLANKTADEASQEALVREFHITGGATIDYRNYDVDIVLNTEPYAVASLDPSTNYIDPNAVNLGNLSSLDASTSAVIPGLSNYDTTAASAYMNAIISALENSGDESKEMIAVQIKNGTRTITNSVDKTIFVEINKLAVPDLNNNQYEVVCRVQYESPSIESQYGVPAADTTMSYVALQQSYKQIPEVYLMYNQFLYYNNYQDDLIQVTNNTGEQAKVYVIRTAEDDSAVSNTPVDSDGNPVTPPNSLIPTGTGYDRDDKNGSNFLYMTHFEITEDLGDNPVAIYTNMPLKVTEGGVTSDNINSSLTQPGNRTCKMSVNVSQADIDSVVLPLDQDERYSEQGRTYNIVITLTNQKTGNVTTFDTSKGDY